jgi:two-component system sensor histidine kinase UhpB
VDGDPAVAKEQLSALQEQLDQVSEGVRKVSHELHPDVLYNLGLETALEALCEEFESQSGVAAKPSFEGPTPELSDEIALCVYQVSQEALQNVAKHAKPRS